MKKAWLILLLGVFLGTAAFTLMRHSPKKTSTSEIAWLKEEFHLNDEQFKIISQLHEAYKPVCLSMCGKIDKKDRELKQLLAATNRVTSEIEKLLSESAAVRTDCQKMMLEHFYQISAVMNPHEATRYLAWVQSQTVVSKPLVPTGRSVGRHDGTRH